jgi:hypothetical protein
VWLVTHGRVTHELATCYARTTRWTRSATGTFKHRCVDRAYRAYRAYPLPLNGNFAGDSISMGRYTSTSHWYRRRVFHPCLSHDRRCRQYSYLLCLSAYVAGHIIADPWQDNTCQVFYPFNLDTSHVLYVRTSIISSRSPYTCLIGPRAGPPRVTQDRVGGNGSVLHHRLVSNMIYWVV